MPPTESSTVTWLDRLRIERVVWTLDQQLYDLPRRARIAHRREVRQNLLNAAADIGVRPALRRLGSSQRLAAEYRSAEFGDRPRPAWFAAAIFLLAGQLVFTALLAEAASAFADGITAADAHATGSYTWPGIAFLQSTVHYTFVNGHGDWSGGAWTPLAWLLWAVATIMVGRLWRVVTARRSVALAG